MIVAMLALLAVQDITASGGVSVENVPQIGIATRHARCIVRRIGVAPQDDGVREAAVSNAVKTCRDYIESDYAQGRIKLGDRVVSAGWWKRMQRVLDAVDSDVAGAVVSPQQYKIIWQLPDGGRVDAYNAPEPLTTIRLLTVPL
jgi:hypothetical protein